MKKNPLEYKYCEEHDEPYYGEACEHCQDAHDDYLYDVAKDNEIEYLSDNK